MCSLGVPNGGQPCPLCGMVHSCAVEAADIGPGAVKGAAGRLSGLRRVLVVSDGNTRPLCAPALFAQLRAAGVDAGEAHFPQTDVLVPDEEAIAFIESGMTEDTDALIGIGAGVINDLCKHVSGKRSIPYMIIATAPSMDGYASRGAALILRGMKVTLDAPPPRWIVGDTDILAHAPLAMIQAGIGDILGKHSCLNDWRLGHLVTGEPFCPVVHDMVCGEMDAVAGCMDGCLARDGESVGALMHALVQVGVAMSYMGNSRPASGSEHHLSHFLEIVGLTRGIPYLSHGIDVAYATLLTCRLRRYARGLSPDTFVHAFDEEAYAKRAKAVFGPLAGEVTALQKGAGLYQTDRVARIRAKWPEILALLGEADDAAAYEARLARIGLEWDAFLGQYGEGMLREGLRYAKDLKDRYSVLWLLEDIGALEAAAKEIAL